MPWPCTTPRILDRPPHVHRAGRRHLAHGPRRALGAYRAHCSTQTTELSTRRRTSIPCARIWAWSGRWEPSEPGQRGQRRLRVLPGLVQTRNAPGRASLRRRTLLPADRVPPAHPLRHPTQALRQRSTRPHGLRTRHQQKSAALVPAAKFIPTSVYGYGEGPNDSRTGPCTPYLADPHATRPDHEGERRSQSRRRKDLPQRTTMPQASNLPSTF